MSNENVEVDYSTPSKDMSSPDLMESALSHLQLIRDTHWSDKDRIGVPLDDDDPDGPGSADRLGAARIAIQAINILIARENERPVSADRMSSHDETINYRLVSNPVSAQDAKDMWQYIQEAYSVGVLLSQLNHAEDVDMVALAEIGKLIVRLLSQPMEAATGIVTEKRGTAEADAKESEQQ